MRAHPGGSAGITLDDISRYCWTAYHKARTASGPQVIGRVNDLNDSVQKKMAHILKGQTLFDEGTQGNILKMDKWCLALNAAREPWAQGRGRAH